MPEPHEKTHISIQVFSNMRTLQSYENTGIPQYYQWIIDNYEFVTSRVDGIFSCDKELCAKYPKISYSLINAVPWVQDRKVHEKTKLVSMIASNKRMCEGHARRLQFVDKFRDKLDFYGRGFNEISCKEDGLRDYMFSVGIENAVNPLRNRIY